MTHRIQVQENFDLSKFTTMGVLCKASHFVEVHSIDELKEALNFAHQHILNVLILGGGSNLLFIKDYEGLVIHVDLKGIEVIEEDNSSVTIKAAAGEIWHDLVLMAVSNNWAGIENLSLIPGSVGAAPIQNIGAYGVELKDTFISLEALERSTAKVQTFTKEECKFGYRDSIFKNEAKGNYIITSVQLRLQKNGKPTLEYKALKEYLSEREIDNPSIREVSNAVIAIRQSKLPDPDEIGNTGSFFKNPVISAAQFKQLEAEYPTIPSYKISETHIKVPAGWLIEQAGWKGKRKGDAGVHSKQALVLVNHGNATGEEIWNLAHAIQLSVSEKFNISLTPEVNIIG